MWQLSEDTNQTCPESTDSEVSDVTSAVKRQSGVLRVNLAQPLFIAKNWISHLAHETRLHVFRGTHLIFLGVGMRRRHMLATAVDRFLGACQSPALDGFDVSMQITGMCSQTAEEVNKNVDNITLAASPEVNNSRFLEGGLPRPSTLI